MKLFQGIEADVRSAILYALHESAIQTLRKTMNTQHARLVYYTEKYISKVHRKKKEDMETLKRHSGNLRERKFVLQIYQGE